MATTERLGKTLPAGEGRIAGFGDRPRLHVVVRHYGEADDAESEDLIRYAIDLGVDHLDSSDMYGWGHNELLIGRAIKGRRDQVVLATKFGQRRTRVGRTASTAGRTTSRKPARRACSGSA